MSCKLKTALPKDAEEIAEIMQASIFLLPRIQVEYGHVPEDEYRQWNIKCLRSDFKTCEKWSKDLCAMKAVTAAAEDAGREEIMGYAIWGWSERAMPLISKARAGIPYPPGGNIALHNAFYSRLRAMEAKHQPSQQFYSLLFLLTSPLYQRRGVGRRLINHGLHRASLEHVPTFLSASPMGYPIYKKMGFWELDRIELDLAEFGWGGEEEKRVHVHVSMMKGPTEEDKAQED